MPDVYGPPADGRHVHRAVYLNLFVPHRELRAGLANISLKTFAFATLFGMVLPTFAFAYLGSSVVSAQWPLIAGGVVMVAFFLAMPKILTKYRTSAFARLFLGPPLALAAVRKDIPLQIRYVGCGAAIPTA